jgi:hypothetical protein
MKNSTGEDARRSIFGSHSISFHRSVNSAVWHTINNSPDV